MEKVLQRSIRAMDVVLTAVSEDKECSQESQYTPLSQFFIDVVEQGPAQLLGERPLQRFAGLGLDPHG